MKSRILFLVLTLFSAPLISNMASAQEINEYSVKFICGKGDGKCATEGEYFTAINVYNPMTGGVGFKKKFAVALPEGKAGKATRFFGAELGADQTFEIDCQNILEHAEAEGFLKGFVVIQSSSQLDIVSVHAATGATGDLEAMNVERYKPRSVEAE